MSDALIFWLVAIAAVIFLQLPCLPLAYNYFFKKREEVQEKPYCNHEWHDEENGYRSCHKCMAYESMPGSFVELCENIDNELGDKTIAISHVAVVLHRYFEWREKDVKG